MFQFQDSCRAASRAETRPLTHGSDEESDLDHEDHLLDLRPPPSPRRRRRGPRRSGRAVKVAVLLAASAGLCAFLAVTVPRHWAGSAGRRRRYSRVAGSPAEEALQAAATVANATEVLNWASDCWEPCGKRAGFCAGFCGNGNACCKYGVGGQPPECDGITDFGSRDTHTCVKPTSPVYQLAPSSGRVRRWGLDCLKDCKDAGYCQEVCGLGNACCRFGDPLAPPECGGIVAWGAKDRFTCVAPVIEEYVVSSPPANSTIRNWGQDCWDACGSAGLCQEVCGIGNACCRFQAEHDPPECNGITQWGAKDRHTCVVPVNPYYQASPVAPGPVQNWGVDCLAACKDPGYCQEFCGLGNACCRFSDADPKPECIGVQEWGSKDRYTCVEPVNPAFVTAEAPKGSSILHWAEDCWDACGKHEGYCTGFCGRGNVCCRFASTSSPPECQGVWQFGAKDRATCVAPVNPVWQVKQTTNSSVRHWGEDCWAPCRGAGGVCPDFCGPGHACCRFGSPYDPPECHGIQEWGAKDIHTCVTPVDKGVYVNHLAEDCWEHCNGAGYCEGWCGAGNACCRFYAKDDPNECKGVAYWPTHSRHTCVKAAPLPPGVPRVPWSPRPEAGLAGACIPGQVRDAHDHCRDATSPELMTFYMYKPSTDEWGSRVGHTNLGNQNFGNIEGVLWHLHRDIVTSCPRKNGINRILRYIVTMRNPKALFEPPLHYQFGEYTEFHNGQCIFNNSHCEVLWAKFGFAVGCTHKPSDRDQDPVYEGSPGPTWYSLPGRCPSEPLRAGDQKPVDCSITEPGGECAIPNGSPTCTWKAEYAGEIRIDELSGISNPAGFCAGGGIEYDASTDAGTGTSFWNGRRDPALGRRRAKFVKELFRMKYPNYPDTLGEPDCPWWQKSA